MKLVGERNGKAVFFEHNIRDIRTEYASGDHTTRSLARKYGVTQSTISSIVSRKTWAHVT
jgi:uncharacterized protein YjcR